MGFVVALPIVVATREAFSVNGIFLDASSPLDGVFERDVSFSRSPTVCNSESGGEVPSWTTSPLTLRMWTCCCCCAMVWRGLTSVVSVFGLVLGDSSLGVFALLDLVSAAVWKLAAEEEKAELRLECDGGGEAERAAWSAEGPDALRAPGIEEKFAAVVDGGGERATAALMMVRIKLCRALCRALPMTMPLPVRAQPLPRRLPHHSHSRLTDRTARSGSKT